MGDFPSATRLSAIPAPLVSLHRNMAVLAWRGASCQTSYPPPCPPHFDPADIEARWYAHWEANGLFRPERPDAEAFTLVNPPPNVTGSLHIGHALDNTLQDDGGPL